MSAYILVPLGVQQGRFRNMDLEDPASVEAINEKIAEGYTPLGSPFVLDPKDNAVYQAMVLDARRARAPVAWNINSEVGTPRSENPHGGGRRKTRSKRTRKVRK